MGGVLRHTVTGPAPLILLRQQAIAHQGLQYASDVLGVFPGDFLHAAIGHAAFHLGCYHRLHRRLVQLGKPVAKAHAQRLVHLIGYQAHHGQHQLHAVGLQRLFQPGRAPMLRAPTGPNLVHTRTRLVATAHELEHHLQALVAALAHTTLQQLHPRDQQRTGV